MFEERIEELNRAHEQEGVTVATANAARFEKRTYTVDEIQDILGISRTSAYNLVNSNAFRIVRIGGHIRIPCKAFDAWLDGEEASN